MVTNPMKLGIMQPYFLPYLGYYSLIKATDRWIVFDISQYVRHSWINRNRIIRQDSIDWNYITIPIKKSGLETPINEIEIHKLEDWKTQIISRLGYYKNRAPYYSNVLEFLKEVFNQKFTYLSELNIHLLISTCQYIGIEFNFEIFSELKLQITPPGQADEWGILICKALGFSNYINPEGGQEFFRRELFRKNNIDLKFIKYNLPTYDQKRKNFMPALSVLDAMMFNSPSELNKLLDDYQLIS